MRKIALSLLLIWVMTGCTNTTNVEKSISTVVAGEMLFSGPNSLQAPVTTSVSSLTAELSIKPSDLSHIEVSGIQISMTGEQATLAESLLLQIVSNNHEMTALGSLSPLENGPSFELNLAEETDILPFIEDEGATWVLDVNLSEDIMDEMKATAELKLMINYKN